MSSTLSANPLLDALKQKLDQPHQSGYRLVIAGTSPRLQRRLHAALDQEPWVMLEVPQADWKLESCGELADAITWAVQETPVRQIVLAGDSAALDEQPQPSPQTPPSGIFERARAAQQRRQQAQEQFRQQVRQLVAQPAVAEQLAEGALVVEAVFYHAESDSFRFYEPVRQAARGQDALEEEVLKA